MKAFSTTPASSLIFSQRSVPPNCNARSSIAWFTNPYMR